MESPQTTHKTVASSLFGLLLTVSAVLALHLGISAVAILKTYMVAGSVGHPFLTWLVRNYPR